MSRETGGVSVFYFTLLSVTCEFWFFTSNSAPRVATSVLLTSCVAFGYMSVPDVYWEDEEPR
jgi:hypothetical protein